MEIIYSGKISFTSNGITFVPNETYKVDNAEGERLTKTFSKLFKEVKPEVKKAVKKRAPRKPKDEQ